MMSERTIVSINSGARHKLRTSDRGPKPNRIHLGLEWDELTALHAIPSLRSPQRGPQRWGGDPKPRAAYWLELGLTGNHSHSFSELPFTFIQNTQRIGCAMCEIIVYILI